MLLQSYVQRVDQRSTSQVTNGLAHIGPGGFGRMAWDTPPPQSRVRPKLVAALVSLQPTAPRLKVRRSGKDYSRRTYSQPASAEDHHLTQLSVVSCPQFEPAKLG
jgi:hypothetical protein